MRPVAAFLLVALLAAACAVGPAPSEQGSTASATVAPTVVTSAPPTSGAPTSAAPSASETPEVTPDPGQAETPTPGPSDAPPTASEAPTASASAVAAACQPEGSNPAFWPGIAKSVSWDVYCAVLPKGWVVTAGSYRLASGGKLVISYKGPGGATLSLSEGSFCTDGSGCVPSGRDAGDAAFGGLAGTLVSLDAGGYAIVVDRGQTPSWLMTTSGLDEATTVSLGAALARVGG